MLPLHSLLLTLFPFCYTHASASLSILALTLALFMRTYFIVRLGLRGLDKDFQKTEDDMKALQSVGQIIGEVLKQLDDERCMLRMVALCLSLSFIFIFNPYAPLATLLQSLSRHRLAHVMSWESAQNSTSPSSSKAAASHST